MYHKETDSLFVFGGYNLNKVLSNLEVYRFETSRWEDEHGNELGMLYYVPGPAWAVYVVFLILASGLEKLLLDLPYV